MKFKTRTVTADGSNAAEIDIPDGEWVAHVDVSTWLSPHPADKRMGINVDGKPDARLRPQTQMTQHFVRIIGVKREEVEIHVINPYQRRESHDWVNRDEIVVVSDKPFAVVYIIDDQEYPSQSGYRRNSVQVARQVHKGELSRHFQPTKLQSRESCFKIGEYDAERNFAPRPIRIVRLANVAEAVEMEPSEILRVFAQVSPSTYYERNAPVYIGETRMRVFVDEVPKHGGHGQEWGGEFHLGWDAFLLRRSGIMYSQRVATWWREKELDIPLRWAEDILALAHFGFIPGVCEVPGKSFELRAECPEAYDVPGMLPVRPIDEIRELRGSRDREIKQRKFEQQVDAVCGEGDWQKMPMLDDRGSFVYYDNFRVRRFFDGRLTIATSFWTRGGSGKGEYWAGFISVHDKPVDDPRRAEARYRLLIWPNQLMRQSPEGAVGGFIPEIDGVEPEIMEMVRKIVNPWGFAESRP